MCFRSLLRRAVQSCVTSRRALFLPCGKRCFLPLDGFECCDDAFECLVDEFPGDCEWGHQSEDAFAGSQDEESVGFACGGDFAECFGVFDFNAEHESQAADVGNAAELSFEFGEFLEDVVALDADVVNDVFLAHDIERCACGGCGEWVSAESGSVHSRREDIGVVLSDLEDTHWDAVCDGFCDGECVRFDSEALECEPRSCTRHAALDFVCEEEEVVLVTELSDARDEVAGCGDDAAFALDGFEHDCDGFVSDCVFDGFQVIEGCEGEALQVWSESFAVFSASSSGESAERTAVEGVVHADDM